MATLRVPALLAGVLLATACSADTSGNGETRSTLADAGDSTSTDTSGDVASESGDESGDSVGDGDPTGDGDPSGDGDGDPTGDGDGDPTGDGDGDPTGDGDGDGDGDPVFPVDPVDVELQAATASFSQDFAGGFGVADVIDGQIPAGDNVDNGWAIANAFGDQIAAFETVEDTPGYELGTRLTFTLTHDFFLEHNLGCFRLAVTTASRDAFADGNEGFDSPGEVGAAELWAVVEVVEASSSDGATLSVRDDGAVLAEDLDSLAAVYTVVATTPLTGITGVRLEALEDPSLPSDGPGLQDSNGNFVLVELQVSAAPL